MIPHTQAMRTEFKKRAEQFELHTDCLMDGAFTSEVAIISAYPGNDERARKLPLVGQSGNLLWTTIRKYGLSRTGVYITNVSKRCPDNMGTKKAHIPTAEQHTWETLLQWELQQLPNVKYILVLGNEALNAIKIFCNDNISDAKITMWRGSVLEGKINERNVFFIVSYNPAHVLREPKFELTFHFDIGKLDRVMKGSYKRYDIIAHINPSPTEAIQWIDEMHDAKVPVAFDIEVVSGETACFGFARDNHIGHCINLRTVEHNRFSLREERVVLQHVCRLLGSNEVQLVVQNGVFDAAWVWFKDHIRCAPIWFDTLLAHHTLYSSLPHSLAYLTAQYTDHPFYKDEGKTWKEGGDIDQYWGYNVKDACITRKVSERQHVELKAAKMEEFFFNHVMRLQPHLVHMIVGGVKCDVALKKHITTQLHDEVEELLHKFHQAVHVATGDENYSPNPNSFPQLKKLFFTDLKLVGRGSSTDATNRKRMLSHIRTTDDEKQLLTSLDQYKIEQKFLTTYARSRIDEDERFRCEYKQYGTQKAPGRLSSAQTSWHTGMNLQNQSERSKPMFIADEGYAFGYFDLEQAEARFVGWDADIEQWKKDFERARRNPGTYDCHRALASAMWDMPYDEVPRKDHDEFGKHTRRYTAKRCRHGLNYRMQVDRLATVTGLSYREALEAYSIYHRLTPELRVWWRLLEKEVVKTKQLYSAYNRRLIILERLTDEALESIVAFKPQSSIGDKTSQVIYKSQEHAKWPHRARIMLNVHDALVAIAKEEHLKTCLSIMKKYAEEPIYWLGTKSQKEEELIIPAECKHTATKTAWRLDADGQLEFYNDNAGFYRWSNLETLDVEIAA